MRVCKVNWKYRKATQWPVEFLESRQEVQRSQNKYHEGQEGGELIMGTRKMASVISTRVRSSKTPEEEPPSDLAPSGKLAHSQARNMAARIKRQGGK